MTRANGYRLWRFLTILSIKSGALNSRVKLVIPSFRSETERVVRPLDGTSLNIHSKVYNLWRVLKVVVLTAHSPERVLRDLSFLKSALFSGLVSELRKFIFRNSGGYQTLVPASWGRYYNRLIGRWD